MKLTASNQPLDGKLKGRRDESGRIRQLEGENGEPITRWNAISSPRSPRGQANAERVVCTWNACQGFSSAALDAGIVSKMKENLQEAKDLLTDIDGGGVYIRKQIRQTLDKLRNTLQLIKE